MKTAAEWYTEFLNDQFMNMGTFLRDIQRNAWVAGARAEHDAIVKDVWGSWAQRPCEEYKIVPFPED